MSKPILITGATGNQGGVVLDALIKQNSSDFALIALTRDATSPAAKRLSTKSKAVQSVIAGGITAAQEETQGKNFIDACIAHNVKILVYTSVDRGGSVNSPRDPTPVSVFVSKHRIEQHLFAATKQIATRWFVLRPTGLFEPLLRNDFIAKMSRTIWKIYMKPGKAIQWVSCKDIGYFAAQGFLDPERWASECLSLAGWEGTFADANKVNREITGKDFPLTFGLLTRFVCGLVVKDLSLSYDWDNERGFGADIEGLRRMHPGLMSLEDYLREQGEK